uniref:Hyaluronan/mRNA-binding protein domain-containing protein n=1 Tax=Panagrolaimus sp. PS1159 TaxID=55785 RepID=A0AC35FLN5_9BILA
MDIPVNDRMKASVVLKNKFAAFCSDDEGGASEIVTAPIKKVEKTSVKKLPRTAATTTTVSASKNHPKPEKSTTAITNKEATRRHDGNGPERPPRDGNRSERPPRYGNGPERPPRYGNGPERPPRDDNGPERPPRDGNRPERPPRDGNRPERPPRDGNRSERPPRDGNLQQQGETVGEDEGKVKNVDRRPYRGDRGTGRSNRGARGSGRGNRIGVHEAPKKDGHGKGNWGTEQDELQGETEPLNEANVEKPVHDDNADKNDSGVELEKEEEKPGMTLNEWKEKNKVAEPETFNIRKPNDDKKLNLAPLKKAEDSNKENEEFVVLRREPREKPIDISVNFASTDHGSGGNRGNRDAFRGRGRGDRKQRGTRVQTRGGTDKSQFNLVTEQFPALGGH